MSVCLLPLPAPALSLHMGLRQQSKSVVRETCDDNTSAQRERRGRKRHKHACIMALFFMRAKALVGFCIIGCRGIKGSAGIILLLLHTFCVLKYVSLHLPWQARRTPHESMHGENRLLLPHEPLELRIDRLSSRLQENNQSFERNL